MKKIILLLVFGVILTIPSQAQEWRMGFTAGWERSIFSVDYPTDPSFANTLNPKDGFKMGITVDAAFSKYFSIQPELFLAQRGTKADLTLYDGNGNVITGYKTQHVETLNYLQLPVNFVFSLPVSENGKIFVFTGAYLAMGMDGRWKDQSDYPKFSAQNSVIGFGNHSDVWDVKLDPDGEIFLDDDGNMVWELTSGEYKKFDVGMNFGFGYDYANLVFKVQWNWGFRNMLNCPYERDLETWTIIPTPNWRDSFKNRNFGISVGFLFN
jgi:hypothetical protein